MENKTGIKWKHKSAFTYKDFYKYYRANAKPGALLRKEWGEALNELNKEFMRMIIEDGKTVRMPHYMSTLGVRKAKTKNLRAFDFKHFNETGEKRYIENEHSDGYQAWFHWRKRYCLVSGKTPYRFTIARANLRALAREMKKFKGHTKYSEYLPNT